MPRSADIAILFQEHADPERYVITALAKYWQEEGLRVHFLLGTSRHVPADLVILHVDLSTVPPAYIDFASRYPKALNIRATDIRKRTVSRLSVEQDPSYDGPVIVKSDLNYGGNPEALYYRKQAISGKGLRRRLSGAARFCLYKSAQLASWGSSYAIFPSPDHVPLLFRKHPYWFIEKFQPERHGNMHAVRTYHFLGRRESFFVSLSPNPLVRSGTVTHTLPLEPDPRLRQLREAMGFDYGKFDYILVDGEPVLIDANKTTGLAPRYRNDPSLAPYRRERSLGIYDYLD